MAMRMDIEEDLRAAEILVTRRTIWNGLKSCIAWKPTLLK